MNSQDWKSEEKTKNGFSRKLFFNKCQAKLFEFDYRRTLRSETVFDN